MATLPPERRPLWQKISDTRPDGTSVDGVRILQPDDPDYEEEYQRSAANLRRFGLPMPYLREGPEGP